MKSNWFEYEFKGFLNRVMKDDQVKILPIWHEVNAEDVYEYNPLCRLICIKYFCLPFKKLLRVYTGCE